jgi:methylmalonyl-CoA mutase
MGGADAITVLPFTQALGLPDAFARRIARNTQLILIEESHLGHVADPAAGAGGFEALTENLCDHAWSEFQRVEKLGGIEAALTSGAFQTAVAATREARDRDIASGREPIVGTSLFVDPTEAAVAVLKPISEGNLPAKAQFEPLVPQRDALIFERLPDPPAV